jgi:hypothetical protein
MLIRTSQLLYGVLIERLGIFNIECVGVLGNLGNLGNTRESSRELGRKVGGILGILGF